MRVWIGCLAMSSWFGTNQCSVCLVFSLFASFCAKKLEGPGALLYRWCTLGRSLGTWLLDLRLLLPSFCCVVGDRRLEDLRTCGQVLAPSKVSPLDVFAVWSVTKALVM